MAKRDHSEVGRTDQDETIDVDPPKSSSANTNMWDTLKVALLCVTVLAIIWGPHAVHAHTFNWDEILKGGESTIGGGILWYIWHRKKNGK